MNHGCSNKIDVLLHFAEEDEDNDREQDHYERRMNGPKVVKKKKKEQNGRHVNARLDQRDRK